MEALSYGEVNTSMSSKNEEDYIAKVDALVAS